MDTMQRNIDIWKAFQFKKDELTYSMGGYRNIKSIDRGFLRTEKPGKGRQYFPIVQ